MSVREDLTEALATTDLPTISTIVDHLRAKRLKYQGIWELAHNCTGITLEDWEGLMQELEEDLES